MGGREGRCTAGAYMLLNMGGIGMIGTLFRALMTSSGGAHARRGKGSDRGHAHGDTEQQQKSDNVPHAAKIGDGFLLGNRALPSDKRLDAQPPDFPETRRSARDPDR